MKGQDPRSIAKQVAESDDPVREIARLYDVKVEFRPRKEIDRLEDFVDFHPIPAGGCIPWNREVFFDRDDEPPDVEVMLHEVVHCICYVPVLRNMSKSAGIDNVCEGDLLLQFERALARVCLSANDFKRFFSTKRTRWCGTGAPCVSSFATGAMLRSSYRGSVG